MDSLLHFTACQKYMYGPFKLASCALQRHKKRMYCNFTCSADFENAGYYFIFAGKLLYGPFQGIF